MKKPTDIGVIIGRFQLDKLHKGHLALVEHARKSHKKIIVFLGINDGNPTKRYPIDYGTREKMVKTAFPDIIVAPLKDMGDDKKWSKQLDDKIKEIFSHGSVTLYGGRSSFIPHYSGKHQTEQIDNAIEDSSTSIREEISKEIIDSEDFRKGLIYSSHNRYPNVYQTTDVAVIKGENVLLARKEHEKNWRFIGGFVDPTDKSLELAAKREVKEEADIEIDNLEYITSLRVDDWRYANEESKIMTAFYKADYIYGAIAPKDDIFELDWFEIDDLDQSKIVKAHWPLMDTLMSYLKFVNQ